MMYHNLLRAAVVVGTALLSTVSAEYECNRTALMEFADQYVVAHENGQLYHLDHIADNFTYMENNATREITSGIFYHALKIAHRHTIIDTVDCSSFTELIITHNVSGQPAPYVIGTQIRHSPGDLTCYLIDLLVSTTGSWLFNATRTLEYASKENWFLIEEGKRDSRVTLKNAADAYLDMWSNATAEAAVPWGTPCSRLEGSVSTGRGLPTDSCRVGVPTNHQQPPNSHRRYVIDPTYGAVSVLCIFEHLDNAPDSHEFRLENGKLRYIHTITLANSGSFGQQPTALASRSESAEPAEPAPTPLARYRVRGSGPLRLSPES
ncbi:hypothetical protein GGS23DRAFT_589702 [Durotheca rogersii]|uniref:uncharacterized protein n=1 Tax=Durotheca rogersii TaxID=419775 RepID=UPI00221E4C0A|nr:uncharacterized protein GGS23DRAFT_589702 [Durotheca rogersii]KAI5855564.1 hypothetical protein GGS23DRAFT_589702 [Durotheca rogersii]